MATGEISYPLAESFGGDLGSDLDKYEKENDSVKKGALKKKIHATINTYRSQIEKQADKLGPTAEQTLTDALDDLVQNVT